MSLLVLSDDDLRLLRFTCDLFFVDESPLAAFDKDTTEAADSNAAYNGLVERGVIDPAAFRITDDALNRIAPVTECDARLVHLIVDEEGNVTQEDHWLLDEIAVVYERSNDKHLFGPDLDADELVARLGRRLVARRAEGERFDAILSASEVLSTSLLLAAADQAGRRALSMDEARAALAKMPSDDMVLPAGAGLLAVAKKKEPFKAEPLLKALVDKKVLISDALGLRLHAALWGLRGFQNRKRHTLVRTDFRDDDWLVREVTLLPVEGSLFVIAPSKGGFRIAEVEGDTLRRVLVDACGPQGKAAARPPMRLATLLHNHSKRV